MESGAVAQVAFLNNIPWLAVRSISDQADSTLDIDLKDLITYVDDTDAPTPQIHKSARRIVSYFRQPRRLKSLWQIRQNTRRSALYAAQVTEAIVARLDPGQLR